MKDTKYNGWSNYETWKVWNDELVNTEWATYSDQYNSETIEKLFRETLPWGKIENNYFIMDAINLLLEKVNWQELADAIMNQKKQEFFQLKTKEINYKLNTITNG